NESRFCLYKSDGRERVWRQLTEKYHRECINMTVKYGGSSGVGLLVEVKGNMNSNSYINILANYFIPWANSLLEKYLDEIELIFQQDLAPIHTSAYSEWLMKSHSFDILEWVPYSSDLNPIKNLWEHLDSMLCKRRPAPETYEELVMCIKEEWYKISL
ncbi:41141_t:CDS:2, partial [Gigaspora margarita]